MNQHSGVSTSVWMDTCEMPGRPPLEGNASADVVVVGAGIAGLTTAYCLARRNKSVIVLDDGPIAGGETERTSAHLVNALDHRYSELLRMHGADGAKVAAESHTAAIATIEEIVKREGIDCDFTRLDGWLYAPEGEPRKAIDEELDACHRIGLTTVERHERLPGVGFATAACLRFPQQARFHPLKYLRGLVVAAEKLGVRIFSGTHVDKFEGSKKSDGNRSARVETNRGHVVTADAIVVATNTPVNDMLTIHTKQAAYRTYVVAMEVTAGKVPDALLWDTLDPFHYVRVQKSDKPGGADLLIVGGEDHKTGRDQDDSQDKKQDKHDDPFARLEAWTRARFPVTTTRSRWSGQVMESTDGLGFIGRNPGDHDNVFITTGDSGNGLTHGTIAGLLLTDLITGVENPWAKVYDPSRRPGGKEFVKENVNMAAQYADWVKPGDVSRAEDVPRGEGAVIRRGLSLVAVYCDDQGNRSECAAACTHLGAAVRWNPVEKTWDCPAHGSRFTPLGEPVNGPANAPLKRL